MAKFGDTIESMAGPIDDFANAALSGNSDTVVEHATILPAHKSRDSCGDKRSHGLDESGNRSCMSPRTPRWPSEVSSKILL